MTKPTMPIGISDFKKVIEGQYYFVDKSMIIKEILDNKYEVMMFLRPRRFGKTIMMSMLKYFFSSEEADENKKLFENLTIAKQGEKYFSEQGQYPVIFLTFKDVKTTDWDSCLEMLKQIIRVEFDRFSSLLDSDKLTAQEKIYMKQVISGTATITDLMMSLSRLTKILYSHFGKKPILLIDEYDEPIQSGYSHGYFDKVIEFMRVFLSGGLKDNTYLNFSVMTGILKVAKESIFSGLNNLQTYTIMSIEYSSYFGFTESEVRQMAVKLAREDKLSEIKLWYDGYKFGSEEIYNPWSVINYFSKNCLPAPYWLNTSSNEAIHILLKNANSETRQNLEELLNGQSVLSEIEDQVIYADIEKSSTALLSFLVMTGYLKVCAEKSLSSILRQYELKIPNLEITKVYQTEILDNLKENLPKQELTNLLIDLLDGKKESFERKLQNMLLKTVSAFDNNESFYHGLILGMTALLLGSYVVRSNAESGYGRFDVGIYPLDTSKPGVILEFKRCNDEKDLEDKARDAYRQIIDKKYDTDFKTRNINKILCYGISFHVKKIKVYSEQDEN